MSRAAGRLRVIPRAALTRLTRPRRRPAGPLRRILIAHHLLLGDTVMLTPLLAKLRRLHPDADLDMTVPRPFVRCYGGRPYGVRPLPFDPRDAATLQGILGAGGYDLAIVPGDNRFAWLALAAGARWIVAFAGDTPGWKSWPVDELRPYPGRPGAWGDLVCELIDGEPPPPFDPRDWPSPQAAPYEAPPAPDYAVLHAGASTPLKRWEPGSWRRLAEHLQREGIQPVFLAGRGEEAVVAEIDPAGRHPSYAGRLALEQVFHLLRGARLLVAPDTGIAHLGRVAGVPTVALFGPGSALICGAGQFWRASPYWSVTAADFACRDQPVLFRRRVEWVRRCGRSTRTCPAPRCMQAVAADAVAGAVDAALRGAQRPRQLSAAASPGGRA